jgi:hypothetical protein
MNAPYAPPSAIVFFVLSIPTVYGLIGSIASSCIANTYDEYVVRKFSPTLSSIAYL